MGCTGHSNAPTCHFDIDSKQAQTKTEQHIPIEHLNSLCLL